MRHEQIIRSRLDTINKLIEVYQHGKDYEIACEKKEMLEWVLSDKGPQVGEYKIFCDICSDYMYWSKVDTLDVCDKHAIEPMDERWDDCK